jgi:hypothetical protein
MAWSLVDVKLVAVTEPPHVTSPAQCSWVEIFAEGAVRYRCKFLMSTVPLALVRLAPGGLTPAQKFIAPVLGIGKDQTHVVHVLEDRLLNLVDGDVGAQSIASLTANDSSLLVFALSSTLM